MRGPRPLSEGDHFDAQWMLRRRSYRKRLDGRSMIMNPDTGYIEKASRRGFTAQQKAQFISLLKLCDNLKDCCRAIPVDVQTVYDHVVMDPLFRQHMNDTFKIEGRALHLTDELRDVKQVEKQRDLSDLLKKAEGYEAGQ